MTDAASLVAALLGWTACCAFDAINLCIKHFRLVAAADTPS